jgi:hypothetical protein
MQAPEYSWRIPPAAAKPVTGTPWIIAITERLLTSVRNGLKWLGKALLKLIEWIFEHLGGRPESQGGALPSLGLHWSLYLLIALIAAALLFVIWRRRIFRRRGKPAALAEVPLVRLEDEALTADRLPEDSWIELAEQCLREQNYLHALRAFFLANLAWLGRSEFIVIHTGKTNREYEIELRRRARPFPEARELFAANVASFERAWYGRHEVTLEQVDEFRRRTASMKSTLTPRHEAPVLQPEPAV